jgi:hypothetical protein
MVSGKLFAFMLSLYAALTAFMLGCYASETGSATLPTTTPLQNSSATAMAPFGVSTVSPDQSPIVCFAADTRGPLITPDAANALIELYNSTICSGNPMLSLGPQEGIVLSIAGNYILFKNQLSITASPPSCDETVEDFVILFQTCFKGFETYGGKLLEHDANYVIATTNNVFF